MKLPAGFDGDYNSLTNRPNLAPVATSGNYSDLNGKPNLAPVATTGNYSDLNDLPTIPNVPTDVSVFNNDAGYLTRDSLPTNVSAFTNDAGYLTTFTESQILSISNDTIYLTGGSFVKLPAGFDGDYNSLTNRPNLAPVATSGNYSDLNDLPTIPNVPTDVSAFNNDVGYLTRDSLPTNVSAFTNDAGYLTSFTESQILSISNDTIYLTGGSFVKLPTAEGFSGSYNDLTDKPTIPNVPTNVSAFTNDAGYLTSFTESQILSISNDTIFLTGGSFVKLPAGFDGDYNSLTNKPNLAPVATSGNYSDLNGKPNLAPVATSGNYNDLNDLPTIPNVPTDVSAFNNDAGYITAADVPAQVNSDWNATSGVEEILNKPTTVSAFTNDAGYLTSFTESQILSISNDTIYLTGGSFVKLPAGFDGDYNSLTNRPNLAPVATSGNYSDLNGKPNLAPVATSGNYNDLNDLPTIPNVPTDVSVFNNDAGYITAADVPAQVNADWNATTGVAKILNKPTLFSGNYNDLTNKPTIPTVPTDVSVFNNDAGYITAADVPAQVNSDWNATSGVEEILNKPTNVSAFNNDAGYVTQTQLNTANYVTNSGTDCANAVDLCSLLSRLDSLERRLQNMPASNNTSAYGVPLNDTCPQRMVMINGSRNVCYHESSEPNVSFLVFVDGGVVMDATYTWYVDGQLISYHDGFLNYYAGEWGPTHNNPHIFTAKVTMADGCSYLSAPFEVNVYDLPDVIITGSDSVVCEGESVTLRAGLRTPGNPMITYQWYENTVSSNNALSGRTHEDETFKPAFGTTDYIVIVTHLMEDNQCYAYDMFRVEVDTCGANGGHTPPRQPTATTSNATNVTAFSATLHGTVSNPDNVTITAQGFEWKTTENGSYTVANATGDDTLSYNLTGLNASTSYTYRAFVTTGEGTNYGEEVTFSTFEITYLDAQPCPGTPTVTDVDGNVYNTVQIGGQCWMRENLRTTKYADGTNILQGNISSDAVGYWSYPNSDSSNVQSFGLLYNWKAVMGNVSSSDATPSGVQGVCPMGWHVPSDAEWTILTDYVSKQSSYLCDGDSSYIAKVLASTINWNNSSYICAVGNEQGDNNIVGFGAVPAGYGNANNNSMMKSGSYFWSATEQSGGAAYNRSLSSSAAKVNRSNVNKGYRYSVRCLYNGDNASSSLLPTVLTQDISNMGNNTVIVRGNVTSEGASAVTERGVCWDITPNPMVDGSHTMDNGGTGVFTDSITGLVSNITYFVRAYASNQYGTVYGNEVSFTIPVNSNGDSLSCQGTPTITDIDGNIYNTVQIAGQCWMRENLRTTKYSDGTTILQGNTNSNTIGYWSYPNDESSAKQSYGLLYNWKAVMKNATSSDANPSGVQGVCPTGWHVPSDVEWTQLTDYVSSRSECVCSSNDTTFIAKALASQIGWNETSSYCSVGNNLNSNNTVGFSAMPAGWNRSQFNSTSRFWSSTENGSSYVYARTMTSGGAKFDRITYTQKNYYMSVRCLKDNGEAVVHTVSVNDIDVNAAKCVGNVISEGDTTVTVRGVCWSTSHNPTIRDNHTSNGTGTGLFISNITGLSPFTTYYVRAYASNSMGIAYGEEFSFVTLAIPVEGDGLPCSGMPTVVDVDSNIYHTVKIGRQCWMQENLRTTHYPDSTSIPLGASSYSDPYYYDSESSFIALEDRGLLYNWFAVMHGSLSNNVSPSRVQGVCPTGWHVPSDAEWSELTDYVSSQNQYVCGNDSTNIAKSLAATIGWSSSTSTNNGCDVRNTPSSNNATGFRAIPAGDYQYSRGNIVVFANLGALAFFWCATETDGNNAYCWSFGGSTVGRGSHPKSMGYSVRCLRDDERASVFTSSVSNVSTTTALCGGNITSEGGSSVTARGVCWSSTPNPTINDGHTTDGIASGTFSSNITGLTPGTTYYVRAYATNNDGTAYGEELVFSTQYIVHTNGDEYSCNGVPTVFDTDGNVYNTVKIGNQCWMRENLRTTHDKNGMSIPYSVPNNDNTKVSTYGLLYTWTVMMYGASSVIDTTQGGVRGICPMGWHIPSDEEWTRLTDFLHGQDLYACGGDSNSIAKALASSVGWNIISDYSPCVVGYNMDANNITGFSALSAGIGTVNDNRFGKEAWFWSSTEANSERSKGICLKNNAGYVTKYQVERRTPSSVRCLRDSTVAVDEPSNPVDTTSTIDTTTANTPIIDSKSCPAAPSVTDHEGNVYATVQIGGQCWMRENLRTTKYADGTNIAQGNNISTTIPYWYYPDSDSANKNTHGLLYNWKAAMGSSSSSNTNPSGVQGICPTGWHLPSYAEWNVLTDYVSSQTEYVCGYNTAYIAKSLASTAGWSTSGGCLPCSVCNDSLSNNSTGFNALPAGAFFDGGSNYIPRSTNFGYDAVFWSSTEYKSQSIHNFAIVNYVRNVLMTVSYISSGKNIHYGYSVRCVLNNGVEEANYLPNVTTDSVTNITKNMASCFGTVSDEGGSIVTEHGFCWNTTGNPTLSDSFVVLGSDQNNFALNLIGLDSNTTYYVKAYATNSQGTSFGEEISFTTGFELQYGQPCTNAPTLTDIDGNVYNTVRIGSQCWMKENVRTTKYADGTPIEHGNTASTNYPYWYYPNNNSENKSAYGLLYNWKAATRGNTSSTIPSRVQGICPDGWHMPSVAEWKQLITYVSNQSQYICGSDTSNIAKALASTGGWKSSMTNCTVGNQLNQNNTTGLSVLPAGYYDGSYSNFGYSALIRTCAGYSSALYSDYLYLFYNHDKAYMDWYGDRQIAMSVRCVLDEKTLPSVTTDRVTDISRNSAVCYGTITSDGGDSVIICGFCWNHTGLPTTSDSVIIVENANSYFDLASYLTNLISGQTYYLRAFATNVEGTSYGETISFTTLTASQDSQSNIGQPCQGTPTVTDHEGNVYNTVQIGNQCWMRENLRTTTSPTTGTYLIPSIGTNSTYTGKQARWYNDDPSIYAPNNYGLLYNWNAAMDTFNTIYGETSVNNNSYNAVAVSLTGHRRGICPEGWHLPSDAEWLAMEQRQTTMDITGINWRGNHAGKLAGSDSWIAVTTLGAPGNYSNTYRNASGFSAVPAGQYREMSFSQVGQCAHFWSSEEDSSPIVYNTPGAWARALANNSPTVSRNYCSKNDSYSVRCLRD